MAIRFILFLVSLTLLAPFATASMSDLDLVIRETVVLESSAAGQIQESDIYGLQFVAAEEDCFFTVTGFYAHPTIKSTNASQFYVCVRKDADGYWFGQLLREEFTGPLL